MDEKDRLDVDEVAAELGLTVEQVIQYCKDGVMDAWCSEAEDGPERWVVEQRELGRWSKEGPRRRMTFEEAMEFLRQQEIEDEFGEKMYVMRHIRRASWRKEALTVISPRGQDDPIEERLMIIDTYKEWRGHDYGAGPFFPSEDDKAATDWVEYDRYG